MLQNEVGQIATADVDRTEDEMLALMIGYGLKENKNLAYLTSFHAQFEQIHPFADGNGRVGRLILYKECLKEGITPFIVDDLNKASYYSALEAFQINDERQPLLDYFRSEQKFYANYLKNKGFEGKINEAKDGDVIKKPEGFSEKLERLKKETQGTTKKVAPSKEEDLSL